MSNVNGNSPEICKACMLAGNENALLAREWALASIHLSKAEEIQFSEITMTDKDQALQCRSRIMRAICDNVQPSEINI